MLLLLMFDDRTGVVSSRVCGIKGLIILIEKIVISIA